MKTLSPGVLTQTPRRTIDWLVRFSRQEQNAVIAISIKDLLTDSEWTTSRQHGSWTVTLGHELFEGMRHVRLRGLSLIPDDDKIWSLKVKPPAEGMVQYLDDSSQQLTQNVPPLNVGRASRREIIETPDVVGISALHNASPIGTWKLTIEKSIPKGRRFSEWDVGNIIDDEGFEAVEFFDQLLQAQVTFGNEQLLNEHGSGCE